jgi:hypothetical protein
MTNGSDQPPSLPGASGNFNFNQQGGTTNQTYSIRLQRSSNLPMRSGQNC